MRIKKIEIEGLLRKDRKIMCWSIDGFKFLYGPNGIGKTTMLDSVYYALTNREEIFKNFSSDKPNFVPYKELKIYFSGEQTPISLVGSFSDKKFIEKIEKILSIIKNKSDLLITPELLCQAKSLIERLKSFIIHHSIQKESSKNSDCFIDHDVADKILDKVKELREEGSPQEEYELTANAIYSQIINEEKIISRRKFVKHYDVLYLTVERMAPDLSTGFEKSEVFKRHFKYLLVKKIKEITTEFEEHVKEFIKNMSQCINESLKQSLLHENSILDKCTEKVSLEKNNEEILKIFFDYLNFSKEQFKKIKKKNVLKEDMFITYKIIKLVNEIDPELRNEIKKMNSFISDVNDFLKTSGKNLDWENKSQMPTVKDDNNSRQKISEYPWSSGERQIITILFNLHFFKKTKLLILADEIELSLSIDWQEMLYDKISKKYRDVELIGVTHSPFVVNEKHFKNKIMAFKRGNN